MLKELGDLEAFRSLDFFTKKKKILFVGKLLFFEKQNFGHFIFDHCRKSPTTARESKIFKMS